MPKKEKRQAIVVRLPESLHVRLKNASGATGRSLQWIAQQGIAKVIADLERRENKGRPFPDVDS